MALTAKSAYKFYKEGGGGQDQADASLLAEAKQFAAIDRDKGNNTLLKDKELGTIMVNVQHMQDDEDNTRTFVQDEDEMLNVIKGTFPLGCYYDPSLSRWVITITQTEFMGSWAEHPKVGGAYWGRLDVLKGAKDLITGVMWVDKIIPPGFQVYRVFVFGSNAGGTGNESQFRTYAGKIIDNTQTGAGTGSNSLRDFGVYQSMDSTVLSSGALTGDGSKTIRIEARLEDKNDVIYGAAVLLTQI